MGCEYSGRVRDAFIRRGHDAISCDILPTEAPGPHIQGDVREQLDKGWDLAIFHPPCTFMARSGAVRLAENPRRLTDLQRAAELFRDCLNAPVPMVAVENPIMLRTAMLLIGERPTQWIEPFQFGHPYTKHTGLWLRNLQPLKPTQLVTPMAKWTDEHRSAHIRSATFEGIAEAMAEQWSEPSPGLPSPLF